MTHEELFNLQSAVDTRIDNPANTTEDNDYWTDWRVMCCKWLDRSWHKGMTGHDDPEIEDLLYALNS